MKYLKYFLTEAEYTAYENGSDFVTPNVSYTVDSTKTFYNPATGSTSNYVMVDLGLPSGLKWADRNIGADSPEDAGLYFAWGETVGYTAEQVQAGEKIFNWDNYFDTSDNGSTFNKYTTDKLTVLEAADDAASVNMGSDWRMPTVDEMQELIDNTTRTYIDLQDNEFSQSGAIAEYNLKGIKFTGTNGNSIFIPAAGYCPETTFNYVGYAGYLWSSNLTPTYSLNARRFYFDYNATMRFNNAGRDYGQPVRAVQP